MNQPPVLLQNKGRYLRKIFFSLIFALPSFLLLGYRLPSLGFVTTFRLSIAVVLILGFALHYLVVKKNVVLLVLLFFAAVLLLEVIVFHFNNPLSLPGQKEVLAIFTGLSLVILLSSAAEPLKFLTTFSAGWLVSLFLAYIFVLIEWIWLIPFSNFIEPGFSRDQLNVLGHSGIFGNPNNLAIFLLSSIPVIYFFIISSAQGITLVLARAAFLLIPIFISLTQSRAATLSGLIFMIALMVLTRKDGNRLLYAIGSLLMLIGFAKDWIFTTFASEIFQSFEKAGSKVINVLSNNSQINKVPQNDLSQVATGVSDNSTNTRFGLIQNGISFLRQSNFFGIGPGKYEEYMTTQKGLAPTGNDINPHNGIIELLSQYGLLPAVIILGLIIALVSLIFIPSSHLQLNPNPQVVKLTLALAIASLCIANILPSSALEAPELILNLAYCCLLGTAILQNVHFTKKDKVRQLEEL